MILAVTNYGYILVLMLSHPLLCFWKELLKDLDVIIGLLVLLIKQSLTSTLTLLEHVIDR